MFGGRTTVQNLRKNLLASNYEEKLANERWFSAASCRNKWS